MIKKQLALYPSVYEAAKFLNDAELGKALRAVMTYHFEPEKYIAPECGSDVFNMFMITTLPLSDSQKQKKPGAPEGNQNARKKKQ